MAEPVRRIRDGKRYQRPQQRINFEEWQHIVDRAAKAKLFFKEDNHVYLTMKASLEDAETMILQNRIREVREVHTISDTLKKIFITPKKIQDDELVGQIKFIRTLFAEFQTWIDFKKEIEKKEADGVISIQRNETDE